MRNILFFFLISIAGCSARKSAEVAMQWDAESPKSLRGQQADGMELAPRRRLFDLSSFLSLLHPPHHSSSSSGSSGSSSNGGYPDYSGSGSSNSGSYPDYGSDGNGNYGGDAQYYEVGDGDGNADRGYEGGYENGGGYGGYNGDHDGGSTTTQGPTRAFSIVPYVLGAMAVATVFGAIYANRRDTETEEQALERELNEDDTSLFGSITQGAGMAAAAMGAAAASAMAMGAAALARGNQEEEDANESHFVEMGPVQSPDNYTL